MNIVVLIAGTNSPSNSSLLAEHFAKGLEEAGATVQTRALEDIKLKHFSLECYEPNYEHEQELRDIVDLLNSSDGFVVATPVWNFGVPAHLKNFIDRLGSFELDETHSRGQLHGKPFYLIFTGGAPLPAWKGLMQKTTSFVPESFKYFGASYIGHHFEGKCTVGRGKFGLVVDNRPESLESVRNQGKKFAEVVRVFKETGKAPVSNRLQSKIMRFGEAILKKFS